MHPLTTAIAATVLGTLLAAPALANADLAQKKSCMSCHATDKKLVGPAYKEVAAKYAGQKDAVAQLAERIQKGSVPGKGNWGAIPMPANPQVNADEAKQLATWVLSVK
ncbi:MAG TPA: c-type cytochrome [Aquabacterium sp.]|nr:c-type cytochrome [Aquabacterium sp.]